MPRKTLTIIGILLILIQISAIPHSWKTVFGIIVGVYLVAIAIRGSRNNETDLELETKSDTDIPSDSNLTGNTLSHDAKEIDKGN